MNNLKLVPRENTKKWSDVLKCYLIDIVVFADIDTVRIYIPAMECTDMTGAIKMALEYLPSVKRIETIAGEKFDTVYEKDIASTWVAKQIVLKYKQPHQQRVADELSALESRVTRLSLYLDSPAFEELSTEDRILLIQQQFVMTQYVDILKKRIARF